MDQFKRLTKNLDKPEKKMVEINHEAKMSEFKFGNSPHIEAMKVVHIPIIWKGKEVTLKMHLLQQPVPTLLVTEAMTKTNTTTNVREKFMRINEQKIKAKINDASHFVRKNAAINRKKKLNEDSK